MKKFLIFSSILISIFCSAFIFNIIKNKPVILQDGTIEYNLSKQSQIKASRILYKYVLKDLNKTPKTAKDFADITPNSVKAFEYDLNNDGKNEIIGVVYSTFYSCTEGERLFILQKKDKYYINLSNAYFLPNKKFYILKEKINNYNEISFYCYNNYFRLQGKFIELKVFLSFKNNEYIYNYLKMKTNNM